jgi:hypothetical protein
MAAWDPTFAEDLWTAIKARLDADGVFSTTPSLTVILKATGDPDKELDAALGAARGSGVAVFLSMPSLSMPERHDLGSGEFLVEIVEEPVFNRGPGGTRKTAQLLEETVVSRLLSWSHSLPISPIVQRGATERPEEGQGMIRRITFGFAAFLTTT